MEEVVVENNLDKLAENKPLRNEKGQLLPGQTANPHGRPKGKTIKERIREFLEDNPEKMDAFVKYFAEESRELAFQMLEGKPSAEVDITSKGESITTTPESLSKAKLFDEWMKQNK